MRDPLLEKMETMVESSVKKGARNGSPMIDKRLIRKKRRNLSKLSKRTLGSLKVRTQH